jgi:FAD/FMN-containing dehydrogenase
VTPPGGETVVALICCYCGPFGEGEEAVRPFKSLGTPVHDALGPLPFVAQQQIFDAGFPTGSNYYAKAASLGDLTDEAIEILIEYAATMPSPLSGMVIQTVFGAASRVAPDATAFRPRAFPYAPIIVSQWLDPAQTAENVAWARDCWGALQPFAGGVYVNDLGENDEDRVPAAYGANYQRLAALKKKYDPDNFFRLNPNIKPAN